MIPRASASLLLLALVAGCGGARLEPERPHRAFVFEMEAELPLQPPEQATIWLPVPSAGDNQELGRLQPRASGGDPVEMWDAKTNRILSVRGTPPLRLAYSVAVRRFRVEPPHELRESGTLPTGSQWVEPARRAPLETVRKEALFKSAGRPDILGKARLLYESVVAEVEYATPEGGGWGHGDLAWVSRHKQGDCSDFHTLFIAYCQSIGIPASFEVGFRLPPEARTEACELTGYHCWARLRVPGMRWIPVDASEARRHPELRGFYFGGLDENRVRVGRGRDIVLEPESSGPPLNFFVRPHAELGGADVSDRLEVHVRFRDIGRRHG